MHFICLADTYIEVNAQDPAKAIYLSADGSETIRSGDLTIFNSDGADGKKTFIENLDLDNLTAIRQNTSDSNSKFQYFTIAKVNIFFSRLMY